MKKIFVFIFLFMFCFLLQVNRAYAVSTIYGSTGLITMPTAEAAKYKEFDIAFDYNFASNNTLNQNSNTYYYKAIIGIFKGWELGLVGGSTPTEGAYINVKYSIVSDSSRFPFSVAAGLEKLASLTKTELYLAASKKFEFGLSANLGFKTDFVRIQPSIMGGLEYFLSDQFSILADITGKERQYTINGGARFTVIPDLTIRGAVLSIGDTSMSYSVGISYAKFF
ncbi:MAG: hypothetical protein WC860_01800 [Candidatus Margulisiibacteriota bacterium]|jgi:hypothetical protein